MSQDAEAGLELPADVGLSPEQTAADEDDLRSAVGGLAAMVAGGRGWTSCSARSRGLLRRRCRVSMVRR
jgi:hypothetical protein